MTIGHDPAVEIYISDPGISSKNAQIQKEKDTVYLVDLGSSNGSFINNRRLNPREKVKLTKEDLIKVGSTILKFLPKGRYLRSVPLAVRIYAKKSMGKELLFSPFPALRPQFLLSPVSLRITEFF